MSDISTVLNEFEIDIVDALTCPEPQAKEFRRKIRDHVALTRQKDVKAKLKIHEWRTERQPPVSATMSPLFNSPFSVSLFHFRLPSFEFGCIKGKEVKNDPRDDCPFCGAKNSNNGTHMLSCDCLSKDISYVSRTSCLS
eukprot:GHVP01032514.1.p1 GENE.GHVP01032514.1~~GHVP01032514.1.p1  ORF type:complete len:139 (+),score=21.12 GHVP01032514.1:110-526(+)